MMNEDFVQYIGNRCDKVVVNNPEYRKIHKKLVDA